MQRPITNVFAVGYLNLNVIKLARRTDLYNDDMMTEYYDRCHSSILARVLTILDVDDFRQLNNKGWWPPSWPTRQKCRTVYNNLTAVRGRREVVRVPIHYNNILWKPHIGHVHPSRNRTLRPGARNLTSNPPGRFMPLTSHKCWPFDKRDAGKRIFLILKSST